MCLLLLIAPSLTSAWQSEITIMDNKTEKYFIKTPKFLISLSCWTKSHYPALSCGPGRCVHLYVFWRGSFSCIALLASLKILINTDKSNQALQRFVINGKRSIMIS